MKAEAVWMRPRTLTRKLVVNSSSKVAGSSSKLPRVLKAEIELTSAALLITTSMLPLVSVETAKAAR
jgi:hypothetical protein